MWNGMSVFCLWCDLATHACGIVPCEPYPPQNPNTHRRHSEFAASEFGLKTFPTLVLLPQQSETVIKYPSERRDVETLRMWLKTTTGV